MGFSLKKIGKIGILAGSAALGGLAGLAVTSSIMGSREQAKAQKKAAAEAAAEQKRQALANVRVQSGSGDVEQTEAKTAEDSDTAAQNKARRRYGLSKTILKGGLLGSSTNNRQTLGGL